MTGKSMITKKYEFELDVLQHTKIKINKRIPHNRGTFQLRSD